MQSSNSRLFFLYGIIVLIVMICIGVIILPLIQGQEKIIVGLSLFGGSIVFLVLIYNIFDKYIKPVQSSAMVANELVKGNYKARTYVNHFGDAGKLSNAINVLARSLQEMTIQEKMQGSQLRTVIDNMESGLMLIDERGYVHLVNRKFLNTFGKHAKDYIGFLYYDVLEQENIHKAVQEAFLYEEKVKNSFTISLEIEKKRYFEIVGAPIFNEANDLKGAVLVFHDITELKRLEQMRKDFVANVSHELKTPITSIRGFAETLLEDDMVNEEIRNQFLTIILTESERLQALVYDLLELSKLEKDELRLNYETIHINELLVGILTIVEQQAQKKQINFTTTIEEDSKIRADRDRLKQIFINLISNAINYTPVGGKVDLGVHITKDSIEIVVSDTGIGIPEEFKDRIFERFYRVDRARSRNTGGTGLGLAIVKHIVEAHRGSIKVESKVDKGTIFRVNLPKSFLD
ncbi:two-component system histidine kinase PnpS [Aquibacillus rhizosphaerae]|uniref:histidine kinase n=1 Tax=Aquibacillus rhizosphaerae TaxID=3051431 RepID=A0ABT7L463_9BACI|nr:ATP-binding protein [Aquibacillus sp. LR5S19]MDL4840656.1 ATP-binding protein [Aquibacillus sp. LR5S19]